MEGWRVRRDGLLRYIFDITSSLLASVLVGRGDCADDDDETVPAEGDCRGEEEIGRLGTYVAAGDGKMWRNSGKTREVRIRQLEQRAS